MDNVYERLIEYIYRLLITNELENPELKKYLDSFFDINCRYPRIIKFSKNNIDVDKLHHEIFNVFKININELVLKSYLINHTIRFIYPFFSKYIDNSMYNHKFFLQYIKNSYIDMRGDMTLELIDKCDLTKLDLEEIMFLQTVEG